MAKNLKRVYGLYGCVWWMNRRRIWRGKIQAMPVKATDSNNMQKEQLLSLAFLALRTQIRGNESDGDSKKQL